MIPYHIHFDLCFLSSVVFPHREVLIDFYLLFYSSKHDSTSRETIEKENIKKQSNNGTNFISLKTFSEEESRKDAMFGMVNVFLPNSFF